MAGGTGIVTRDTNMVWNVTRELKKEYDIHSAMQTEGK